MGDDPARLDSLDSAFRAIHTLKGSTGLFEVKPLGTALTAAEDLLGAMRARVVVPDAELADAVLRCIDQTGPVARRVRDGRVPAGGCAGRRAADRRGSAPAPADRRCRPAFRPCCVA
ncbi:MAG: Hpt domain-containing protein [Aliidongia sp.]